MKGISRRSIFLSVLISIVPLMAPARTLQSETRWRRTFSVEVLKPALEGTSETPLTAAYFLSLRIPLTTRLLLTADVPLAHAGLKDSSGTTQNSTGIGNPSIGLELRGRRRALFAEVGLRLPIGQENGATAIGYLADYDRFEAFVDRYTSLIARGNAMYPIPSGPDVYLWVGPAAFFNIEKDTSETRAEAFFDYGIRLREEGAIAIEAVFTGRVDLTGGGSFARRNMNQLKVAFEYPRPRIAPAFYVKVPFDAEVNNVVNIVVGMRLTARLR